MNDTPSSPPDGPPPVDPGLLDAAVDILREAGELTLRHFRSRDLVIDDKADGTPVTAADRGAERLIRERLAAAYPDDSILGEEEATHEGTSGRTWIIDPIDGTKAFTHGVPLYSNLLALDDEHGPAIGVVNIPALGETVWAGRGLGCFANGEPAHVSTHHEVRDSWLMTSGLTNWTTELLHAVQRAGVHVRTWGDGYGYAMVAMGRAEAMLDPGAAIWDVAPMPVIMSEAGGRFTSTDGRDGSANGSGLGTNGLVHAGLLDLIRGIGNPA
ncbi:MAG: inositol monophosphatase [Acidimicrobiia bacterium]|nr:inositol monophosphatase [Acidimicrobiia bacterium]